MVRPVRALAAALFLVGLLAWPAPGEAQETGLAIQPLRMEYAADPGQEIKGRVRVANQSSAPVEVVLEMHDFSPDGGLSGGVTVGKGTGRSITGWGDLFGDTVTTVPAKGTQDVFYTLRVPLDAPPGGYYGAVVARTNAPGSFVRAGVASLVLVTVRGAPGELRYKADAEDTPPPATVDALPLTLRAVVRNDGNVHFRALYRARITDWRGGEVIVLTNGEGENVLPASARELSVPWQPAGGLIPTMGRFTITQQVTWGAENTLVNLPTRHVWVIPAQWLATLGGAVLAVFMMIVVFLRMFGSYVASQAQQSPGRGRRRGRR